MTQIAYPYAIDQRGRTALSGEERHLRDLIEQVLFTSPGERINRPGFGAGLRSLVFEPGGDALATAVQASVQAASQQHLGSRIGVEAVDVVSNEETLHITVVYRVQRTGQRQVAQFQREV